MNYQNHYDRLIEKARNRNLPKNTYFETHHIIPKCMGGSNDKSNLVELLPEEHLVAHLLLSKINPTHRGLIYSANILVYGYNANSTSKKIIKKHSNKTYGWIRRKQSSLTKGVTYIEKYGSVEKAKEEAKKRGLSISKSQYHSNGGLKGLNNPNAKEWILVSPEDIIFDLSVEKTTLVDFSKIHNLNVGDLTSVANNKLRHSKLWLCFYKEKFNLEILAEKKKVRDSLRSTYQYYKLRVTFNNSTKIYDSLTEIVSELGANEHIISKFISEPNYVPKLLKHRFLSDGGFKIEKIM